VLAYSKDPSALITVGDLWGRTPVHLAAASGNARALELMQLRVRVQLIGHARNNM